MSSTKPEATQKQTRLSTLNRRFTLKSLYIRYLICEHIVSTIMPSNHPMPHDVDDDKSWHSVSSSSDSSCSFSSADSVETVEPTNLPLSEEDLEIQAYKEKLKKLNHQRKGGRRHLLSMAQCQNLRRHTRHAVDDIKQTTLECKNKATEWKENVSEKLLKLKSKTSEKLTKALEQQQNKKKKQQKKKKKKTNNKKTTATKKQVRKSKKHSDNNSDAKTEEMEPLESWM